MTRERGLYTAKVLGVAAAYYGSAKLGLSLAFEAKSVTAIWPPTGIALAAIVIWGYRLWPGVALGAFLANSWTGVPFVGVLGITAGNTLEALTGAFLLSRVAAFRPSLERVRDVIALVVLAGVVSTVVSATIGVGSLFATGEIDTRQLDSVWRTWWLGDMGGDLLVAPALLVAATRWPLRLDPRRLVEAAALAAAVIGISLFVFSRETTLIYLIFPPLILVAIRFLVPGAAAASLVVGAIAVVLTEDNAGPFAGQSPDERLLLAQTFVGVAGITALVLAAVTTERERAEEGFERIAGTLQESLMPARLPKVAGVDIAAYFHPAGKRYVVGGDFYDLFETTDGAWAAVVGDVCGKGARAAALTGLARYTIRAAAEEEARPSDVLGFLNRAILRQSPGDLCTAAYVRLEPDGGQGKRLTLSVAGHPLPLLLRSDGTVEAGGRHGSLLGAVADAHLQDHPIDLRPGDALVLYTDGLTEAFAPARILRPADLISVLAPCAGQPPDEIVESLRRAVLAGREDDPRDDIAVLVLAIPRAPGGGDGR